MYIECLLGWLNRQLSTDLGLVDVSLRRVFYEIPIYAAAYSKNI